MRVLHVFRKLDPQAWGGTEMAMQRMFQGLRERGVSPVIYCPRLDASGTNDPLVNAGYRVRRYNAFMPVLGMSRERKRQLMSVGGNLMSFDLLRWLWRERGAALIHTHTLGRIGGIALTAALRRKVPFVVSIHGGVLDLPEKIKSSFNAPTKEGWEWGKFFGAVFKSHRLFVDSDAILTCNEREAELLRQQLPGKRILVQAHGVPMETFQTPQAEVAFRAFPELRERPYILSLGRIDPVKNQAWLVAQAPRIFREHPSALLILAGPCTDEEYGRNLNRQIAALGLQDRVTVTGGFPPNDPRIIGLLQRAQLLVLPSLSETFGLVILEAWAAGAPVLCSRTSGASALVRHGINGWLFDLDEPEARGFHECLGHALRETETARVMAAEGASMVARQYSIAAQATQLSRLYEELVEARKCTT